MELTKKVQSLKIVFLKYLVTIGIGLGLATLSALLCFLAFNHTGLIISANQTENQILENQTKISQSETFDSSLIPKEASYMLLSTDDTVIQTNMRADTQEKAKKFHQRQFISTPSSSFIELIREEGYVIINYSLEPHYKKDWMEKYFPPYNLLFLSLIIVFALISTLVITLIWAKRITKELAPMLAASENIAKHNLDFTIESSSIKEFNDVLNSLDKMKAALSEALRENWEQAEHKRNQISSLTHDLKIPISIVQGNAELLKTTELSDEQRAYVEYIIKNSHRVSNYTKALTIVNKSGKLSSFNLQKVKLSTVVEDIIEIVKELTFIHDRKLYETINFEEGAIMIDWRLFERVIQNILSNALQYSPADSLIELRITTTDKFFLVTVSDNGPGFSREDLIHGTEQFYRGDKSRHSATHYGLGLYNARQIMARHNGKLTLANHSNKGGAQATLELPLL